MTDDASVVVAGAGLAGLVAARHLAEGGADVTVYERREAVGGRVRSRTVERFTCDYGFQVLFTGYPAARRELDLDALDLRRFTPGAVVARPNGRSTLADPLRAPGSALETVLSREVTVTDKLRVLALRQHVTSRREGEFFAGRDASIREYLKEWGFSGRFIREFAAPFYGGITLDRSLSTSKHVFEYTFRMLAEGATAVPADGMGAISRQLAAQAEDAGATLQLGEAVESVADDGATVELETADRRVDCDAVVLATDPGTARDLTGLEAVPTEARGCVAQHYALPSGPLDAGKKLLLNAEDARPNTVAPMSAVAPEYGDGDEELLTATFLGRDLDATGDEELLAEARAALTAWYPERSFEGLRLVATDRVPLAQFAQPPGTFDRLPGVRDAGGRTYLAGDYTRWSSLQGAMDSGREAARAALADLR